MINIQLAIDTTDVTTFTAATRTRIPKAIARSINRGLASGRTFMKKVIAADTHMKSSDVLEKLPLKQATPDQLVGELTPSKKSIPLIEYRPKGRFPSRGSGGAITYTVGGQTFTRANAFIAEMGTGHRGVFVRVGKSHKSHGAWSKNLPIKEQYGPSLQAIFARHQREGAAAAQASAEKNLDHDLSRICEGFDVSSSIEIGDNE